MTELNTHAPVEQRGTHSSSDGLIEQRRLRRELVQLRQAIVVSALIVLGGLVAVVLSVSGIDWFIPTIIYFVVAHVAWTKLA